MMYELFNIRKTFTPVQPTVKNTTEKVVYSELIPDNNISKLIYCYWQLKTTKPLSESYFYRVVADGCIDLIFDQNNPAENFVMGFSSKYIEFPLDTTFNFVGVRFLPAAFPLLFEVRAAELTNRFENLKQVLPKVSENLAQVIDIDSLLDSIKPHFDNYFCKIIEQTSFNLGYRFFKALDLILKNRGI